MSCRPWVAPTLSSCPQSRCCTPAASTNQKQGATWQVGGWPSRCLLPTPTPSLPTMCKHAHVYPLYQTRLCTPCLPNTHAHTHTHTHTHHSPGRRHGQPFS